MFNAYFTGLLIAVVMGWGAWIIVLNQLSPFLSPLWALTLFYSSFFIALMSTFSLLIYAFRYLTAHPSKLSNDINISLRQGAFFAIAFCLAAFFQRLRVLTWWNGILLFLIVILIEFYLLKKD